MKPNPETHPDRGPESAAERGASPAQLARIQGFEETDAGANAAAVWQPFSERRVRVAIVGEGVCSFGSQFGYQTHPNAEVVAVSDLDPDLCLKLQERTRAKKAYPTFEELLRQHAASKSRARRTIVGIGVTANESRLDARQVMDQIGLVRRYGLAGEALFDLDVTLEKSIFPYLRLGMW